MRFLFAVFLSLSASAASSQPIAWPNAVNAFASRAEIEAVALQFPNSTNMQRRRIAAALDAHDAAAALDATRRLAAMGATLSPASRARVAALVGDAPIAALAPAFDANAAPVGESVPYAEIGTDQRLIEGLIWDPHTGISTRPASSTAACSMCAPTAPMSCSKAASAACSAAPMRPAGCSFPPR